MNSRFKDIRISLGLTQAEFGKKINLKKPTISELENGKRSLSDRVVSDVCREYGVSEKWLRYGGSSVGMFSPTPDDELMKLQSKYNLDQLDIKILQEYLKLSPDHRKIFKGYFANVFGGAIASEDEAIDLEVESYRKELEDERRFSTSGVSPGIDVAKDKVG